MAAVSIWCSRPAVGTEPHGDEPPVGHVLSYVEGFSNHYPTSGHGIVEAEGWIDTASIPVWCVPGHEYSEEYYGDRLGPWLRLTVDTVRLSVWPTPDSPSGEPVHVSVVLDEAAVQALVDDMSEWLDRPKAHPQ
jgi:hypothetical protein